MLGYEEKVERLELLDAVADAGRLARGLDQLLESLAHADQLDPLDVEGILALRSISEKCAARIGDAARILEAQNEVLYAEERKRRTSRKRAMRTRTKGPSKPDQGVLRRPRSYKAWASAVLAFPVLPRAAAL